MLDLDADERYPDSCFVEDPAVVMEKCAIITNPARDSRNGEKFEIIDAIKKFYHDDQIFYIESPGTMEGGDVMRVGDHFYVGQSDRTNAEGLRQFKEIVTQFGYTASGVPVTEGLHLKDFVVTPEELKSVACGTGLMQYEELLRFVKTSKPYMHATLEDTNPDNAVIARKFIQNIYDAL